MDAIFIAGQVPSSKNSRQTDTKTGRTFPSKQTQDYKKATLRYWQLYKGRFFELSEGKQEPFIVGFLFVRRDKRRFDWVNPVQTIQDLMVDHGWIKDDNSTVMVPYPLITDKGQTYIVDSANPGVYIKPIHLNEGCKFNVPGILL